MALEIIYSAQYADSLETILKYFDDRNGNDRYSKDLLKMIREQIHLLAVFPEIGRQTNYPSVRITYVDTYGIEYEIREKEILIVDIYSCHTDPTKKRFLKK